MSAGAFVLSRYQASYLTTNIHPIRVQPETINAATVGSTPVTNTAPTGAINVPISASVSRSKRSLGLRPRSITMRLTGSVVPTGYLIGSLTRIPCLTNAFFNAASPRGTVISYLGTQWTVTGADAELTK